MFKDILKIALLLLVLFFVYMFLQKYAGGGLSWINGGSTKLQITDEELWGAPSPSQGTVLIESSTATNEDPTKEYIRIGAPRTNTSPVNLTGWSLHSIVSDTRMYLPPATLLLKMSEVNTTMPVHLAPGEYAILSSGHSPIANSTSSFHTNACIGYVSAFNTFVPEIESNCNNPSSILPPTPQNITTYGATCIEFLAQADSCRSYTTEMPAHLLPACRDLIARKLTYHSCLSDSLGREGYEIFNNGGWYLYFNHNAEVWRNNYEAIQLLDENGLVVDVLKY